MCKFSNNGRVISYYLSVPYIKKMFNLDRLAGAALLAPVINYWWPSLPTNLTKEAYSQQNLQDQWTLRVAHYLPWLTYLWNTQRWFPSSSVIARSQDNLSRQDREIMLKRRDARMKYLV